MKALESEDIVACSESCTLFHLALKITGARFLRKTAIRNLLREFLADKILLTTKLSQCTAVGTTEKHSKKRRESAKEQSTTSIL